MKIISETSVRDFGFWSGGADRAKDVKSDSDWDVIENELESAYPDGMTDGELNDFFWFDFDTIAQWLGYKSEEHYFYGAAKDEEEMFDVIQEHFPDANESAIEEWCSDEWEKNEVVIKETAVHKSLVQTAIRMKQRDYDINEICKITGLSREEIEAL